MTSTWWWLKKAHTNLAPHTWQLASLITNAGLVHQRCQKSRLKITPWEIKVEWVTNQMLWKERKSIPQRWLKGKYLTKWSHSKTCSRGSTFVTTSVATDSRFDSIQIGFKRPSALRYKTMKMTLSILSLQLIASTSNLIKALRKLLITSSLHSAYSEPLIKTLKVRKQEPSTKAISLISLMAAITLCPEDVSAYQ